MTLHEHQCATRTPYRIAVLLVCATMFTALPAFAQPRSISGVVSDPQGAVVVGAQVTLIAPPTAPVVTVTDGEGGYRFGGLAPGRYVVDVRATGFQPARRDVSLPGSRARGPRRTAAG